MAGFVSNVGGRGLEHWRGDHAQIDLTWWIWQNRELTNPKNAISATITVNNTPPSRNGALDDWLEMGILGTGTEIKNTMFTTVRPLCYIYV
jgi:tyrosinase